MITTSSLTIKVIERNSLYLEAVKALWRNHADTLGFFPEGAFQEYAAKKQILVALDNTGNFLGYLLFRITPSRNDASIVHLCVDPKRRSQGTAKELVKELLQHTKQLRGVGLRCRRDFSASKLWPKLGFSPVSELAGKSINGSTLTYWWYDNNHPDLFTHAKKEELDQKLKVAIDANVFIDLKKESNEESMALTADWLRDSIAICVTDEIFNEIHRSPDPIEREECRRFATTFHQLSCTLDEFNRVFTSLSKYLPIQPTEQDKSDFAHVATAIHAKAEFFVTRDDAVLGRSDELYKEFGISVLRPSDLIIEIDSLYREQEYQPARLAGTLYEISKVQSKQESLLVDTFQNQAQGETKSNLKDQLRQLLSSPRDTECLVAWTHQEEPIGLIAYRQTCSDVIDISLFRVTPNHPLSMTIIRFLIGNLLKKAVSRQCLVIQISDQFLGEKTKEALSKDHFVSTSEGWSRLSFAIHTQKEGLLERLNYLGRDHPHLEPRCSSMSTALADPDVFKTPLNIWQVEAALWPAKLIDLGIPCFIVPIQPQWALHLFDEDLANHDLFGAKDMALNRESIYYRSKRNSSGISVPARILWYVCQDKRYPKSGTIRAHSRLEEVMVGSPKLLYRQCRRLGIYEWKDVYATAKNNINAEIMALRFSETEMLEVFYPYDAVVSLLARAGIKTQLQSPCRIPESVFFSIISNT